MMPRLETFCKLYQSLKQDPLTLSKKCYLEIVNACSRVRVTLSPETQMNVTSDISHITETVGPSVTKRQLNLYTWLASHSHSCSDEK